MTTTTSYLTSIPTAARGKVRAFVKGLPGFDDFAAKLGVESRDVKNADLLIFAAMVDKADEVKAIIDEAIGAVAYNAKRDAEIESMILNSHETAMNNVTRAFDLDTVLADIDQFLSPVVRKSLAESLMPILDAANKPEVVREVEKIVVKDAPIFAPMGQVPYATPTGKTLPFNKLFGTRSSLGFAQKPISLWESHGMAPSVDPYFVIDAEPMAALATAAEHETNVWLVGPSGAGKSSMPRQFAAYTGRPFTLIQFTKQTSVQELVGGKGAENGSTKWEDGSLIAAMKRPGMVIFIDEPTLAPAGVQAIIQNVTDDHRTYTIHETGEVVRCAPGVVFVIADNTNGTGDETGQYAGTNQANTALVNRFKRMIRIDYLTKAQETAALLNHCPGTPQAAAEHIVDFMQRARKLPEMEGIALSLRQMVGFVGMVKDGFSAKYSMECAILVKLPATERAALETMATLQWTDAFEQLVSGVSLSNMPSNSKGAAAFDDEVSAELNR
jgi:cobaltochelatase CobS